MMKHGRGLALGFIFAMVIILLTSFTTIINFIADYQWFKEVGYDQVFLTKLMTQIKIGVPLFLAMVVLIYLYLLSIKKNYYKKVETIQGGVSERRINQIALLGAGLVSFMMSGALTGNLWFELLSFFNATSFGLTDPIFNKDISFYMFQLPLVRQIYYLLITFIILLVIVTVIFYLIMVSLRRPALFEDVQELGGGFPKKSFNGDNGRRLVHIAMNQLTLLGFIFLIILGVGYFLRAYDLLYSPRGVAYGASYTDVNITLWQYRILTGLSVLSALLFVYGAKKKQLRTALLGPVVMIVVSIAGNLIAAGVQSFIVAPDEISKERQYLAYNIEYTKLAYGLDQVEERSFAAEQNLTRESLERNKETIRNILINDYRPTKQFYNQRQTIRPYYQFNDIDIDRYIIDGQYTQVFLSARELDKNKVNEQWINQYLKYTHGYGVALSPVNTITSEGQPKLLVQDIPPQTAVPGLEVTVPGIYFGELTNDYVITNTKEKEFDYPSGEQNAETIYEGNAGIRLSGLNKLLYAIKQGNLKMLISGNIESDSRILMHRNIHERVRRIAPFIQYDEDPYIVIHEGRLFWIIDGYTISGNYPYAQPYINGRQNYMRNAVKVVIDAYNGDTTYYVSDPTDPIIQTLGKIFPQLLTAMDQMPEGLQAHIRYPQVLFDIQSAVYSVYHVNDIEVFYQGEDLWDIAHEKYGKEEQVMESNYFIMKLPGEEREEFVLSIPYTPKNKPNMTALLMARNDGENYGKLVAYKLPKQKNVYGPMQIENKIDQDTNISKEFTLWGQQGSSYTRGHLLTIPIEDSFIYVEAIYLEADNRNSMPEVKRVIVAYGDRIAYENTLEEALTSLFGTEISRPETAVPQTPIVDGPVGDMKDLIIKANQVFNQAQEAQRAGNWAEYGKAIDELRVLLEQLNQQQDNGQ